MRPQTFGTRALRALVVPFALAALAAGCETETPPYVPGSDGSVPPGQDSGYQYPDTGVWAQPGVDGGSLDPILDPSGALPADVCGVLDRNGCLECHSQPPGGGAHMPLTLAEHFKGMDREGQPMATTLLSRIQNPARPMPPGSTGRPLPPAADVATLKAWIEGGMQGVAGGECKKGAAAQVDGGIKPEEGIDWATRGWPEGECEHIVTLGAHKNAGTPYEQDKANPYPLPATETHYECFWEQVPWKDNKPMHAIGMRAVIETPTDKQLVHHFVVSAIEPWNLSVAGNRPDRPGDHKQCDNPNGSTMAIWAPGAVNPLSFPRDVGVLAPSAGSYLELQIHYNNQNIIKSGALSSAKYEICFTSKLRPQTAGVFWLGFENAFADTLFGGKETRPLDVSGNNTAVGRCEAKKAGRILSIMPHMHEKGLRSKFEIVKKNGQVQTIIDDLFDFQDQKSYFQPNLTVEQGDVARSTCKWSGTVNFGFGSKDEMCFFYTLAYPIDLFKANSPVPGTFEKGFVGGDLACSGQKGP